jgi:hypothetical protein
MNMRKQKHYVLGLMSWRYWFIRFHDTAAPALNLAAVGRTRRRIFSVSANAEAVANVRNLTDSVREQRKTGLDVEHVGTNRKIFSVCATSEASANSQNLVDRIREQRRASLDVANSVAG